MGDPSRLRFVPASKAGTPIDWTRVPEETKKYLIEQYGHDWDKEEFKPLPATIADLAEMFDKTKFFGFLKSGVLTVLVDISEFGLQPTRPTSSGFAPVGPRFYMTYFNQVWFFLFAPGTRECIVGNSDDIIRNINDADDDASRYEKWAADETAMAQNFDVRLEQDVSRGVGMGKLINLTNKLSGWTATTAQSSLECSQYVEAIMTLPGSHPAYRGLMADVLGPFFQK